MSGKSPHEAPAQVCYKYAAFSRDPVMGTDRQRLYYRPTLVKSQVLFTPGSWGRQSAAWLRQPWRKFWQAAEICWQAAEMFWQAA